MKTKSTTNSLLQRAALFVLALATLNPQLSTVFAQGTAFTYQGRMTDSGGTPVSGTHDLELRLYDVGAGGTALDTQTINGVTIANGLFTVSPDFGSTVFNGDDRWLEITDLTTATVFPRQSLTPTPYAIYAGKAAMLDGALPANQLTGTYSNALTLNNPANAFAGSFTGNGAGLSNIVVNASNVTGSISSSALSNAWRLVGNAGTTAGTHFLGTTDNQPVELKVNNSRALRIEPGVSDTPNLNGGYRFNVVDAGVRGATISGGGGTVNGGGTHAHRIGVDFGTIGGGVGHLIEGLANDATIGGGYRNAIQTNAHRATIGGGYENAVRPNANNATIGGGYQNTIQTNAGLSTIAGGFVNTIQSSAAGGSIGGGLNNTIQTSAFRGTISGGEVNVIQTLADYATISGGYNNNIGPDANYATIGGGIGNSVRYDFGTIAGGRDNTVQPAFSAAIAGGEANTIQTNAHYSTIGGGYQNTIQRWAAYATIVGGQSNTNRDLAEWSTIGGGNRNVIQDDADYATIAGGRDNDVGFDADHSAIGGGYDNNIGSNSYAATLAGGYWNMIGTNADYAIIAGGRQNTNQSQHATIAGGSLNNILPGATNATVGGGFLNTILADSVSSMIGGGEANTIQTNVLYSIIAGGKNNLVVSDPDWLSDDEGVTISGGVNNIAGSRFATIGGGEENVASGTASTVGGGQNNTNEPSNGTISGGANNTITYLNFGATISGGEANIIDEKSAIYPYFFNADYATISGGRSNEVHGGRHATISGGTQNQVTNAHGATVGGGSLHFVGRDCDYATISGGADNTIYSESHYATIGGGVDNFIGSESDYAAIGGGASNYIGFSAKCAVIPGGSRNYATSYAFAAGYRARAIHAGSFVWADLSEYDFDSTATNQVIMRASGGYALYSDSIGTLGVSLAPSGTSWSVISDRNAKKNFTPVDSRAVLEKLAALPIQQWNYKTEPDDAVPHLGPVAQDFKAAFYPGRDDKHISTLEFDGVALAAIQGLNEKVESGKQIAEIEIKSLKAENAELKQRLDKLERLMNQQNGGGK